MSKIVLVAAGEVPAAFVASARRITGASLSVVRAQLQAGQPFWEAPLFGNDHENQAAKLRALADEAAAHRVPLEVYELEPEETFDTCPKADCRISVEIMKNILDESDPDE